MQAYIISSKNLDKGLEEAEKIIAIENVNIFDKTLDEFEKDLGIEDVRNIKNKIFLKPFKGDKKSNILVLKKSATNSAQNAMLKLLEEPPPSTIIIIIAQSHQIFLPTILSRVKVIAIKNEKSVNTEGFNQMLKINGAGDALYLAQEVSKNKDQAIAWLENTILTARVEMLKNLEDKEKALKFQKVIKSLEHAHSDLKNTNVNTRLALENLFLNL